MNGYCHLFTGGGINQNSSSRKGTEINTYCILVHLKIFVFFNYFFCP